VNFVIDNDGALERTKRQVEAIYYSLRKGEQPEKQ
jgi:hypothetical protein